ncbi:MAG: type II and III secretion system protein [Bacteroidetes bacterium]|nr:type II and III secretion system protein [Bacteroidota bacterium]
MKSLFIPLFLLALSITMLGQRDLEKRLSGYVNPDELVSLSVSIPFDQAIEVLSKVSEKLTGKKIVSLTGKTDPVGIEIDNLPYKRALNIIVQYNSLLSEEKDNVIIVKRPTDKTSDLSEEIYASVDEREVKITAVFFEANVIDMRERGINWQFVLSAAGITLGGDMTTFGVASSQDGSGLLSFKDQTASTTTSTSTQTQAKAPDFQVGTQTHFEMGKFVGDALGIFKFFESENLGEIISKPSISVRNKTQGRIQIGSDISIKQRDFAGNIIEQFQPTGTIVEVTPFLYTEDNIDYVLLKLNLERSSATVNALTTEIAKTMANTDVLLLNGEETVIGGLYINDETSSRRGIPILKDLPWWFFGLRYLFGYDQQTVTKKEVIILIKAEILPTLKERVDFKRNNNLIKEQYMKDEEDAKRYKVKKSEEENNAENLEEMD